MGPGYSDTEIPTGQRVQNQPAPVEARHSLRARLSKFQALQPGSHIKLRAGAPAIVPLKGKDLPFALHSNEGNTGRIVSESKDGYFEVKWDAQTWLVRSETEKLREIFGAAFRPPRVVNLDSFTSYVHRDYIVSV